MARRDDVNQLYLCSRRIEDIIKWLFWTNVVCSVASCIFKIHTVSNILLLVQILVSIFCMLYSKY